jgi:hypothetical protein
MAKKKPKTKKSLFDTLCTETEPGVWSFEAGGPYQWQWIAGLGLNLRMIQDGKEFLMIHAAKLDHAVLFAHGFAAGADYMEDHSEPENDEEAE